MGQVIDPSDLTFNGKEVMGLNEAIYTKVFVTPAITELNDIRTGIKAKTQIVFLGTMPEVGRNKSGCDTTDDGNTITNTEQFWEPVEISGRDVICYDPTLKDSFFQWGLKNGIERGNLDRTEFMNFLQDRYVDALSKSVFRLVWFGDSGEDTNSNAGNLTNGTDATLFTPVDGLWKKLIDLGTSTAARKTTDLTSLNGQANYAAQAFDDTDTTNKLATKFLQNLIYGADMRLRQNPSGFIAITQSIMDQYERERASQNLESGVQILENGLRKTTVLGVPVYAVPEWDRYISTFFNDGTKYYLPHRGVYTTKENIPVGTTETSNFTQLDAFYSKDDKNYKIDFKYDIDTKLMEAYMTQVGF